MGFYMGKVLEAVFFPPGIFIVGLAAALVLTRSRGRGAGADADPPTSHRWLRLLLWALLVLVWVSSIAPTRYVLMRPLETRYPPIPATARPDVIVVLGGGMISASPEAGAGASPSQVSTKRAAYAFTLHRRMGIPMIVSGGDPYGESDATEGALMRSQLIEWGVPPWRVLDETRSANTLGSARFVKALLARGGFTRPALVTSARHMPRSVAVFRSMGVSVIPAPTDYTSLDHRFSLWDVLPSAGSLDVVGIALHEYMGMLYYKVAYGV
jgi:uncharacterized SAM-binding protein YcdF (DUF218 family)